MQVYDLILSLIFCLKSICTRKACIKYNMKNGADVQLPPAKKRKVAENIAIQTASEPNSSNLSTDASITSQSPSDSSPASHNYPDAWNKKQQRKKKRKKYQSDLPDLFFSSNWKIRGSSAQLYDKVLIDAHCTLDASIRHILQYNKVGWKEFTLDVDSSVIEQQKKMIKNGFRLLKEGGILVYSTCSFCQSQNEDVVQHILDMEPTARVVPIDYFTTGDGRTCHASPGSIPNTLRFYPKHTGTSGMFIARIEKKITGVTT